MNKFLLYQFQFIIVTVLFFSCQFDNIEEKYDYSTVYFVYQDYNRNVIVGEGLDFKIGVTLTGLITNEKERIVYFEVDPSLLDGIYGKSLLPSNYYSLEHPNQIVIPKGNTSGYLTVKIDSVLFLKDPKALTGEYVLPIRIVDVLGVDTIKVTKSFTRISLSYFGKQFGNYHYYGEINKFMGSVLFNSYTYGHDPKEGSSFRFLETIAPTTFRVVRDTRNQNDPMQNISFLISVPVNSTEVTLSPDTDSLIEVNQTEKCTYDPQNRKFHLEYFWTDEEGANCYVIEELTFRNRIYDDQGNEIYINEWR